MSLLKLITTINWALLTVYGGYIVYILFLEANPHNDAGGQQQETAIKGIGVVLLLILVGLNSLSYSWIKILVLLLTLLLLLLIYYVITH